MWANTAGCGAAAGADGLYGFAGEPDSGAGAGGWGGGVVVCGAGAAEVGGGLRPTHLTPPSEAGGDPDSLRDGWGNRHEKQVLRCAQDDNFQGAVRMDSKDKRRSRVAR
jgi:hypothetical protein